MRREAAIERVGRAEPRPGQSEIPPDMAGAQIQKARGADIGEQADPGLRHRQQRLLGRDPVGAVDRNPGPAAHRDAVDDREIRFRIAMDAADQLVFFPEKHRGQIAIAGNAAPGLVDRAHVAAGAERALAGAAHQHGTDHRVIFPGAQHRVEAPIHAEREGVKRPRPVQHYGRDAAFPPEQDVIGIRRRFG